MKTVDPRRREAIYLHSLMAVASVGLALFCAVLIYNYNLHCEKAIQTEYHAFETLYQSVSHGMTVDAIKDLLGPPGLRERTNKQLPRGTVWIWTYQVQSRQYRIYFFANPLLEENPQWRVYDWKITDPYDQKKMMIKGFQWISGLSIGFYTLFLLVKFLWKRMLASRTGS